MLSSAEPPVNAHSLRLGAIAARAYREGFALGAEWADYLQEIPPAKRPYRLAAVLQRRGVINLYSGRKKDRAPLVRFEFRRPVYVATPPGDPDPEGVLELLLRVLARPVPSWRCRSAAEWVEERVRRRWFTAGFRAGIQ